MSSPESVEWNWAERKPCPMTRPQAVGLEASARSRQVHSCSSLPSSEEKPKSEVTCYWAWSLSLSILPRRPQFRVHSDGQRPEHLTQRPTPTS